MMSAVIYLLQFTRRSQHKTELMVYVLPAIIIGAVVYDLYTDWKKRSEKKEQ